MKVNELQVAVDVGARRHRVAVGDGAGRLLEEFDLAHTAAGFAGFFERIAARPIWRVKGVEALYAPRSRCS